MKTLQLIVIILVLLIAGFIQYLRFQESNTIRTVTRGNPLLKRFDQQGTPIETYEIVKSDEESHRMKTTIYQNSICGGNSSTDPSSRPCTPPFHFHTYQVEQFTVEQGLMAYYLHNNSVVHYAKKGETVTVTPGWHHTFWSESKNEDLIVYIELFPGGKSRSFFENFVGLMNETPNDILSTLYTLYAGDNRAVGLPEIVNRIIIGIAKLVGKKPFYPEYTTNVQDLQ
jgi:mannose-6-phosphate isomerase-like protein (cupin superfamily)